MRHQKITTLFISSAVFSLCLLLVTHTIEAQRGPHRVGMTQGGRKGVGRQGLGNPWGNPIQSGPIGRAAFSQGGGRPSTQGIQQAFAQQGPGGPSSSSQGRRFRGGGGAVAQRGPGNRGDAAHAVDMQAIQFLLANRSKIRRNVVNRPDGVETLTESDDPKVTAVLVEHVAAMYKRVEEQRPIHARDPLFAELFRNAATLEMKVEKTDKGVKVIETSSDPFSVKLIQSHAQVVSLFLKNGHPEVRKNHPVPQ